jgi:hypothetical protein
MNRRARRAAAARARRTSGRSGYMHRLIAAHGAHDDVLRGKLTHAVIEHDSWCGIYRGRACDCVPDISLHPDGGGNAIVVDVEGRTRKVTVS